MRPPDALELPDLAATARLATAALAALPSGSLLILTGPLGVGKTTFTQALVAEIDPNVGVTSPTYGLVHEYPTPSGPVVHMDAYRLGDARALDDLGLDDYLEHSRLVVVEWGAELAAQRPDAAWLELGFDESAPDESRRGADTQEAPDEPPRWPDATPRWALWRIPPAGLGAEAKARGETEGRP